MGWLKNGNFSAFSRCIFGTFRDKANIIVCPSSTQFSTDPKIHDLEWPFYVCDDDHFADFADK